MNSAFIVLYFLIGIFLVGAALLFSSVVSPRSFNPAKSEPYECGIPTEGPAWIQFNVGYYLFAIIFLVFDVESLFLFPWAVVMRSVGLQAFIEIVIFLTVLGLGLVYAWKKKALQWV